MARLGGSGSAQLLVGRSPSGGNRLEGAATDATPLDHQGEKEVRDVVSHLDDSRAFARLQ